MKFYLAATFGDKSWARHFARRMKELHPQHECTSRWLWEKADEEGDVSVMSQKAAHTFATADMEDVHAADALVYLTGTIDSPGKSTEAGIAVSMGIPIYPVGHQPTGNIFIKGRGEALVSASEFLANPFPTPREL